KGGRRQALDRICSTSSQAMLAEHLYGACLRSLVAHLLEKRDARAGRNLSGATIEQAVLVKIDLATVLRLQKAETADVVEAFNGRNRRGIVGLDLTPHAPRVVLQPPPCSLERVIQRHDCVGVTIVGL